MFGDCYPCHGEIGSSHQWLINQCIFISQTVKCLVFQGYDFLLNVESIDKKLIHVEEEERYLQACG